MLRIFLLQTNFEAQKGWLLSSDKVYSILVILLIIFGLMAIYLLSTNRKISRLEKKMNAIEDN